MTVFNDILIPRFKRRSRWIFFTRCSCNSRFLARIRWFAALLYHFGLTGDPIARIGYKNGVIIGL